MGGRVSAAHRDGGVGKRRVASSLPDVLTSRRSLLACLPLLADLAPGRARHPGGLQCEQGDPHGDPRSEPAARVVEGTRGQEDGHRGDPE